MKRRRSFVGYRKKAAVFGLVASTRIPSRKARRGPTAAVMVSPARAAAPDRQRRPASGQ